MSRRRRIRANDIARKQKTSMLNLILLAVGLALIIYFKVGMGEEAAGFFDFLTHDPDLELPEAGAAPAKPGGEALPETP